MAIKFSFTKALVFATAILAIPISASGEALANTKKQAVKEISRHFESVPTMKGEFVQFGPNGEQTGGTFFIQRPGKMRLDYEKPSPLKVISNGKTVAVRNTKLKTRQFFPLSKTPLSLLLAKKIKLNNDSVRSVDAGADVTRIVMGDKSVFGNSEITLLFDPKTYDLRQWTIKDSKGKETSVMVFNVQNNVKIPGKMFKINKAANKNRSTER